MHINQTENTVCKQYIWYLKFPSILYISLSLSAKQKCSMDSCRMSKEYCAVLEGKQHVRNSMKQFCAESDQPIVYEEVDPVVLHKELQKYKKTCRLLYLRWPSSGVGRGTAAGDSAPRLAAHWQAGHLIITQSNLPHIISIFQPNCARRDAGSPGRQRNVAVHYNTVLSPQF
jgi:hypothetical protein